MCQEEMSWKLLRLAQYTHTLPYESWPLGRGGHERPETEHYLRCRVLELGDVRLCRLLLYLTSCY